MRTESVVRSSMGKMLGRRFPRRLPVFSTLPTRPRVSQRTQSKVNSGGLKRISVCSLRPSWWSNIASSPPEIRKAWEIPMHYLMLNRTDQNSLLSKLQAMPDFLEASFGTVSPLEAATPGPNGAFSPVEHCWHLADLEREGYAVRIRRLLEEDNPGLPDFDGARIARERSYTSLSVAEASMRSETRGSATSKPCERSMLRIGRVGVSRKVLVPSCSATFRR